LNSVVNARRLRLAMTHSYRTFVRSGVSTKPGQVQSTQSRYLPMPLSQQDITHLRNGTAAIYVYGEIGYRDAFGKDRATAFRSMHHASAGRIGISTELTFCDEGNSAT